jgi:WD repeat-containing protein 89
MYTLTPVDECHFSGGQSDSSIYVLDVLRTPSNGLVTISSDQALSLFDPTILGNGPATSLKTNHGNLTTLSLFGESVVCTAGENGTVGVWDLRERKSVAHFTGASFTYLSIR